MDNILHIIDDIYPDLSKTEKTACLNDVKEYQNDIQILDSFKKNQEYLKQELLNFNFIVASELKKYIKDKEIYKYIISNNLFFEKSPYKTDYIYLFYKLNIIIDYIKNNSIKEIVIYSTDLTLIKFFKKFANKNQLKLKIIKNKSSFSLKSFIMKNKVLSFLYKIYYEHKKLRQKLHKNTSKYKKLVVSYYPNYFVKDEEFISKYYSEEISKILNKEYDWLFIYAGDILKLKTENNILKSKYIKNYNFLDNYFEYKDFLDIYKIYIKILKVIKSVNISKIFIYNNIDYYDIFIDDWKKSLGSVLIDTLIFEKKFRNFFNQTKYEEVIYLMEYQPWESMLNKITENKIISKGVTHSIIRPNLVNYYYHKDVHKDMYLPKYVGVNSNTAYQVFKNNGFDEAQIFQIEAQRFNYLNFIKPGKILNNNLLITTSIDRTETEELLIVFAKVYKENIFDKIYIKAHPDLPVNDIIKNISEFPIYEEISGNMQDAFAKVSIVYTTNSSSVLLESLLNNKLTITLFSLKSLPMPALDNHPLLNITTNEIELKKALKQNIKNINFYEVNNIKNILYLDKHLSKWKDFINV